MKTKKTKKMCLEPEPIFKVENDWPEGDDPTTTLATVTFTHLNPSFDLMLED